MSYSIGIFTSKAERHDYPDGAPSMVFVHLMPKFSVTVEVRTAAEIPTLVAEIAEQHGVGYSTTARAWGRKPRGFDALKSTGALTVTCL